MGLLPNPYVAFGALVGFILAVTAAFFYGQHVEGLSWQAAIAKQKQEAAEILAAESAKVVTAERAASELKDRIEKEHANHALALDNILVENRALAVRLGGLRDPGRRASDSCPPSPASKPSAVPPSRTAEGNLPNGDQGVLLSDSASDFILRLGRRADAAAEYATACHGWLIEVQNWYSKLP